MNWLIHWCRVIPFPLPLIQKPAALDDPDWIFEIKYDGFRALTVLETGRSRFLSRNKHKLYGFRELSYSLASDREKSEIEAHSAGALYTRPLSLWIMCEGPASSSIRPRVTLI
jgi:hypothetical protein